MSAVAAPRVAGAPISWGVSETPGWGVRIPTERVLAEAAAAGLSAIEAGPDGYLPPDPADARALLAVHGLRLVGGFVPAVLHRPELRARELAAVERQAHLFAAAGGDTLVLAAATGEEDYDRSVELGDAAWRALAEGLEAAAHAGAAHGLAVALHPHYGTAIERRHHVLRALETTRIGLCLDTGHLMVGGADPVEIARLAGERVAHVHLKDVDGALAAAVAEGALPYGEAVRRGMYVPLGRGDARVREVVALLERAGYRGWYVLEQDVALPEVPPEGDGPLADVRASIDYLARAAW